MKKTWIIILLVLAALAGGYFAGKKNIFSKSNEKRSQSSWVVHRRQTDNILGWWREARESDAQKQGQKKLLSKMTSNPYLQGYVPAQKEGGITQYDEGRTYQGLNLFSSGHAPQVFLMDMKGEIFHEWSISFQEAWPDPFPFEILDEHKEFIRRAYLYPNGDLLAIFDYIGILKLNKDSQVQWRHPGQNHHDIYVAKDGRIFTLGHKVRVIKENYPRLPLDGPLADDYLEILTPDGELLERISIFNAFHSSPFSSYLELMEKSFGDVFHTNTIFVIEEPLDQHFAAFDPGDILISMRNTNTIAVIDGENKTVKWAMRGFWRHQHQPILLSNGNMLVFDNQGGDPESYFKSNQSRIIEFHPFTKEIQWEYRGTEESPFYTDVCGYIQRLPNGNTLITETMYGRAFEVIPEGEIVWEYISPFRAGEDNELVAIVLGMTRLDPKDLQFLAGE
jgi:hypothetical protein